MGPSSRSRMRFGVRERSRDMENIPAILDSSRIGTHPGDQMSQHTHVTGGDDDDYDP